MADAILGSGLILAVGLLFWFAYIGPLVVLGITPPSDRARISRELGGPALRVEQIVRSGSDWGFANRSIESFRVYLATARHVDGRLLKYRVGVKTMALLEPELRWYDKPIRADRYLHPGIASPPPSDNRGALAP